MNDIIKYKIYRHIKVMCSIVIMLLSTKILYFIFQHLALTEIQLIFHQYKDILVILVLLLLNFYLDVIMEIDESKKNY